MSEYLDFAVETARAAGAILRAEFDRPKEISYKGEVDIVTESDKRSEALIVERLRKYYPAHGIVAEEGSGTAAAGARFCWHVDPLDGTTNFAHGYPCFAVSIGLAENGRPIAGVVDGEDYVPSNILTLDAWDPKSGTAEFKATAIRVEKADAADGPAPAGTASTAEVAT